MSITHPGSVFCLESAAALLGLPIFGEPRAIHVLADPHATARLHGGIRVHTTASDRLLVDTGGLLVTSLTDTTVDIARTRHHAVGLATADAALRADPTLSVESLVLANESRASIRGRRIARWPLHRASELAETPLESVSRAAIEWLGFDSPVLQQEFRTEGRVDRCDLWWPHASVIGEADGDIKYDGSIQDPAHAVRNEKARDRRLHHHADGIAHWGWADVGQIAPLRAELLRTGLRPDRVEATADLHALRDLLRRR